MFRVFKVKELQARKRALVAESEAYRQSLILEFHNVQLYTHGARRKFGRWALSPWLLLAPLAGPLLRFSFRRAAKQRQRGLMPLALKALAAWRFYQRFGGVFRGLLKNRRPARSPLTPEEQRPAANI